MKICNAFHYLNDCLINFLNYLASRDTLQTLLIEQSTLNANVIYAIRNFSYLEKIQLCFIEYFQIEHFKMFDNFRRIKEIDFTCHESQRSGVDKSLSSKVLAELVKRSPTLRRWRWY